MKSSDEASRARPLGEIRVNLKILATRDGELFRRATERLKDVPPRQYAQVLRQELLKGLREEPFLQRRTE